MYSTSNSQYGKGIVTRQGMQQEMQINTMNSSRIGLENIGNTCYINSVLQCLIHLTPVTQSMNALTQKQLSQSSQALQLFYQIWFKAQTKVQVGSELLRNFKVILAQNPQFNNMNQQDCIEFFHVFMDLIQQEQVRGSISNKFLGQISHQIQCSTCLNSKSVNENFLNLSLYIPNQPHGTTITALIKDYFKQETVASQEPCQKCRKKSNLNKSASITTYPEVLVIQLKRYDLKQNKSPQQICIEKQLKLTSNYQLQSVINHQGNSMYNGHYTTLIRQHSHWLNFNDLRVSEYPNRIVDDDLSKNINSYVLFYQKF